MTDPIDEKVKQMMDYKPNPIASALNRYVSLKIEDLKISIIEKIAEMDNCNSEDYSEGGNHVFYKEERIGEINFDFSDGPKITATFIPTLTQ